MIEFVKVKPVLSIEERDETLNSHYCQGEAEIHWNKIFNAVHVYYKNGGVISFRCSDEPTASIFSPHYNRWGYFSREATNKVYDKLFAEEREKMTELFLKHNRTIL